MTVIKSTFVVGAKGTFRRRLQRFGGTFDFAVNVPLFKKGGNKPLRRVQTNWQRFSRHLFSLSSLFPSTQFSWGENCERYFRV